MTADELMAKVVFKITPIKYEHVVIEATLPVLCEYRVSEHELKQRPTLIDHIKARMRHDMARLFYEDQRKALYEAIDAQAMADPWKGNTYFETRKKLLDAAQFQESGAKTFQAGEF